MKLSEAIRLNGMSKPQGFGVDSMRSLEAPCALGGALQSVGRQGTDPDRPGRNYELVREIWPWLVVPDTNCPDCAGCGNVLSIIWHLNDVHLWTRQQIADWVATIEPQEEPVVEVIEPAVALK
jgi:hypothetical protein